MGKKAVFTFGRFNPITAGHAKVINKVIEHAHKTGADNFIFTSKSHDPAKNPLPYHDKITFLRSLFPQANVKDSDNVLTIFQAVKLLTDMGYDDVTLVVGSDRVQEFHQTIGKYVVPRNNPKFNPKKHYPITHWRVISAGERDPDADGVTGISGTKMREFVKAGDFKSFAKGSPTNNIKLAKKMFDTVKRYLKEDSDSKDLNDFIEFAADKLKLDTDLLPKIIKTNTEISSQNKSFGGYSPSTKELTICTSGRHPMDVYRTVAHELVHHKQNLEGRIKDVTKDGNTGSDIENEANSLAGIIMRDYAKQNPKAFVKQQLQEDVLQEGMYDPGIFKAIFLAGGPGSGKDFIMRNTMAGLGLIEINSDIAFEFLMKKEGLSFTMPSTEREKRDLVRGRAKNISKEKQRLALIGRLGLIINGTADDYAKTEKIKTDLEALGYDTMMLFVNTSDDSSKERNIQRGLNGGREVPEIIRVQKWQGAQENIGHFQRLFGSHNFVVVDNSHDIRMVSPEQRKMINNNLLHIHKQVAAFISFRPTRSGAISWLNMQKKVKNIREVYEEGKPETTEKWKEMTPGQHGKDDQTKPEKTKNHKYHVLAKNYKGLLPEDASIQAWATKESTINRYVDKYGKDAEKHIVEAANKVFKAFGSIEKTPKKLLKEIRQKSELPNPDEIMSKGT